MKMYLKYLLIFIYFSFCNSSVAQYIPLVKPGAYWIYNVHLDNDQNKVINGIIQRIGIDTIHEQIQYYVLIEGELQGTHPCPPEQKPCFVPDRPYVSQNEKAIGLIRESAAEKKVYYKPTSGSYCNKEEYVLFDFSLEIGQRLDSCKISALGGASDYGYIESIESQHSFGLDRVDRITTGIQSYIGLFIEGNVALSEGIGYKRFGLFHHYLNLNELIDFCSDANCELILSDNLQVDNVFSIIYPNPIVDQLNIMPKKKLIKVQVFSSSGNLLLISRSNTVDVSTLPKGHYLVSLLYSDQSNEVKKIVKL